MSKTETLPGGSEPETKLRLLSSWLFAVALSAALLPSTLLGANFIVDQAAPGAADANPGTEDKPLTSIQRAVDLAKPGDVVSVMEGRYPQRIKIRNGGAEGAPITIRAVPRRSVIVSGFEVQADYVAIVGFEITAEKPAVAVQLNASHCEVLDNYIHDMSVAVSGTVGKPNPDGNQRDYSAVAHNRIAYNKVYHSQYGFMLGGNDWLVENNEVDRLFMYSPGNRYDDCDYSRFFGRGCVQRFNYYHGSISREIGVAHVDCLQTFTVNGEIAEDLLFENNTCFDFHQMCMVESAPHIGSVKNWTLRGNIVEANAPTMSGGWGPDIIQTLNVTIAGNTISGVRWATIGLRGKESTNGVIRNNILTHAERALIHGDKDFSAANPQVDHNLTFATSPLSGESNLNDKDPLFVDRAHRNFRVQKDSPAIRVGQGGVTIGALDYPNVYYVDPHHPAATDEPAWGYPAVPLRSLSKAGEIAEAGATILLRGGIYRGTLQTKNAGVGVKVMEGEKVTISGADLVEGWKRESDGTWSAPLSARPQRILRDGVDWSEFTYDSGTRRISVKGQDPRLHQFETLVRTQGLRISDAGEAKVEGQSWRTC